MLKWGESIAKLKLLQSEKKKKILNRTDSTQFH